jgi:hypothetical protein
LVDFAFAKEVDPTALIEFCNRKVYRGLEDSPTAKSFKSLAKPKKGGKDTC